MLFTEKNNTLGLIDIAEFALITDACPCENAIRLCKIFTHFQGHIIHSHLSINKFTEITTAIHHYHSGSRNVFAHQELVTDYSSQMNP